MKLLLVLFVAICFTGVYADELTNLHRNDELECAKQHNVDAEVMAHMRQSPDFVPNRDEVCFAACVMKKSNMMDANGKFTENFTKKTELALICPPEYGDNECETVGKLMKCLRTQNALAQKKKTKETEGK